MTMAIMFSRHHDTFCTRAHFPVLRKSLSRSRPRLTILRSLFYFNEAGSILSLLFWFSLSFNVVTYFLHVPDSTHTSLPY